MNQFLQVAMNFQKPRDIDRGALFRNEASQFELVMEVGVSGTRSRGGPDEVVVPVATHVREVVCPPHTDWCSSVVLFTENFLAMESYRVNVTLIRPYASFDPEGTLVVDAKLRFNVSAVCVNAAATQAEVGFRFFCFTLSTLFLVLFLAILCMRTEYRHWTLEHKWAITLLVGAALFSNPFILAAIYSPRPEWSIVNTFSTVLFINLLLSFWLVYMHLVVLAGANRVASSANIVLTASFYLPKALFMNLFGLATLFASIYLVYRLDTDPAFSAWEETPYASFLLGIGTALAVIYTLWFLVYTVFALRALVMRSLSKQFVLFLAMTFTAFIAVVAAYFAGALAPIPRDTVTTLTFFMTPNLYVWVFTFVNIPGLGQTAGGGFSEAGELARSEAGRAAASADPDAAGILADTLGEEDAARLELELAEEGGAGPSRGSRRVADAEAAEAAGDAFAIGGDDDDEEGLGAGDEIELHDGVADPAPGDAGAAAGVAATRTQVL